ncbi:hypothetical protein GCM10010532_081080 [Dactylosporangium siamense]|uniref:Uncharacterized protein n=1 Tax=Dactylosporangium siamense TaxID=685454 RepID=A0A919PNP4_9ACTN|nr:hypothetical protein Dsi01nite_059820 [Dactylosporangium siamense]
MEEVPGAVDEDRLRVRGVGGVDRVGEHAGTFRGGWGAAAGTAAKAERGDDGGGQERAVHPFSPLREMPSITYRWARTKSTSAGTLARTAPAMTTG